MAVVSVAETSAGISASQELDGLKIGGRCSRVFDVSFDTADTIVQKQIAVLTASAGGITIPAILELHSPEVPEWFCLSKTARPKDLNGVHWIVQCDYIYMPNPVEQIATIKWDKAEEPAVVDCDSDGKAVVSSAGESFDPPVMENAVDIVGRIQYADSQFDALIASDYTDSCNQATLRIDQANFPPYTVKIKRWAGDKRYWGVTPYYEVYLEIQIRLAYKPGTEDIYGWAKQIIDQGFYRSGTFADAVAGGQIVGKVPIRNRDIAAYQGDSEGINPDDQVTSPVLLDGNGGILPAGAAPVYLYFKTKKRRDFSIFNLRW